MKKLQLKKEVIANLDNQTSKMVKGGTDFTTITHVPTVGSCYCNTTSTQIVGCVDTIGSVCYCPGQTTPEAGCPAKNQAGEECQATGKECAETDKCANTQRSLCVMCN